jgi:hypothetical protein
MFNTRALGESAYRIFENLTNPAFYVHWRLLKGQSHEKVGEMREEGDGLGPN